MYLWTNPSLWYPAGCCWRNRDLEKDCDVIGECTHGRAQAAGHTASDVLSYKGLQWSSKPRRTPPWHVPGKRPMIHP